MLQPIKAAPKRFPLDAEEGKGRTESPAPGMGGGQPQDVSPWGHLLRAPSPWPRLGRAASTSHLSLPHPAQPGRSSSPRGCPFLLPPHADLAASEHFFLPRGVVLGWEEHTAFPYGCRKNWDDFKAVRYTLSSGDVCNSDPITCFITSKFKSSTLKKKKKY